MKGVRGIRTSKKKDSNHWWTTILIMALVLGAIAFLLAKDEEEQPQDEQGSSSLNEVLRVSLGLEIIEQNGKDVIVFKNKQVFEDSERDLNFDSIYNLNNESVILLSASDGSNGCTSTIYRLLRIKSDHVEILKPIDLCKFENAKSDEFIIEFPNGIGSKIISKYRDGNTTEYLVNTSSKLNNGSEKPGFAYLASKKDFTEVLTDAKLQLELRKVLAGDFDQMMKNLQVASMDNDGKYLVIQGNAPHQGGTNGAILIITLDGSGNIYTGMTKPSSTEDKPSLSVTTNVVNVDSVDANYPTKYMDLWTKSFANGFYGQK